MGTFMDDQIVVSKKDIDNVLMSLSMEKAETLKLLGKVQTKLVEVETQIYQLSLLKEGKLKESKNE